MKQIFLFIFLSLLADLTVEAKSKPSFKKINKIKAMNSYRNPFKKSDSTLVRNLLGRGVGHYHGRDTSKVIHSVYFSREALSMEIVKGFFKGKVDLFTANLPNIDPKRYDGFRIHTGIDKSSKPYKAVYLLTFGKVVKKTYGNHEEYYVDDNLSLGVYKMNGIPIDFDSILFHDHKFVLTHLSCYPNCDGDKLK